MQSFDFPEVVTAGARHILSTVLARGQAFSFDYQGPLLWLEGDAVQMQCGIHRLQCGVADLLKAGFVFLNVKVALTSSGCCDIRIGTGGSGPLAAAPTVSEVLERLHLQEIPSGAAQTDGRRSASGICPNTGASVVLTCLPNEGVLIHASLSRRCRTAVAMPPDGAGACGWLIGPDGAMAQSLVRQLQRLRWGVTRFSSCAEAAASLIGLHPTATRPAWVVVVESGEVPSESLLALDCLLPASTVRTLAVPPGSAGLQAAAQLGAFEVQMFPLSPTELYARTAAAACGAVARSGLTVPAPLFEQDRPVLLVVDDNEVNRILGSEMAGVLGYAAATADDGLEALERCSQHPPQVVLMDLDMPRLDGLETTRRIRRLQSLGELPPFSIIALTAQLEAGAIERCVDAGMDGFLAKPLSIERLDAELRRAVVPARHSCLA
ncbi:response regulator [Aquabacterium sp. A7-Y]|uniref:response regulator n=1 Tax=Aquabacterium sp. A7-Y TaxID=1349605 RepID=UPI00223D1740|nr:response regulator [Aquabacterium sp. A7-Y]MCW7539347.1 response regulator [Aquabacterium sp. A7-Y]